MLPHGGLKPLVGRTITNHSSCSTAQVGTYGKSPKTVTGAQYGGTRKPQDALANLASGLLSRAKTTHMGGACGFKMTYKGIFSEQVNQLAPSPASDDTAVLQFLKGVIADLMLDTKFLVLPEGGPETFGDRTLCGWKSLSPGAAYSETTSTDSSSLTTPP